MSRRTWLVCMLIALGACRQDMHDQPRYEPLETSAFFADGRSSRPLVPGTVPRGHLDEDRAFFTGMSDGKPVPAFPFVVTREVVERGQERYEIFCTPCHGRAGRGDGMIVQRGFREPPSLHIDRLREAAPGYLFDVITRGFGAMPEYAAQIPTRDRWAIVAYLRALQLSQGATLGDAPPGDAKRLEAERGGR